MKKLLVTGGAGFIGSHFIQYWLAKYPNDHITNLDLLTYAGNESTLEAIVDSNNYEFVKGNIIDDTLVNELATDVDLIVHFAAETHVDRSILGPAAFIETNVRGTFVLLEAARTHNTRFHHISTDEVFGALSLDSTKKFDENTPYQPSSPYSASKAGSDHLVRAYAETYQLPVSITNCSNNFGPFQHPEKFIPRMITNLIDNQPIKIYGDGKYVRDWLYVKDHCHAIDEILNNEQATTTYLVGGMTEDISNLEVAQLVLKHMNKSEDSIEFVKDRPGHDRRYAVDWSKINQELSWQPAHTFEEWLEGTITWYQENESWWRPLKEETEAFYSKAGH